MRKAGLLPFSCGLWLHSLAFNMVSTSPEPAVAFFLVLVRKSLSFGLESMRGREMVK